MTTWLEIAKNLRCGHKTRHNCECGKGKTLVINHNQRNYHAHCFRCDFQAHQDKGTQTLAELARIRELNEQASEIELELELSHDFTEDIPLHGRLWLYRGGITESVWKAYGIGYSESLDRVVLPVYDADRNLVWYQCRAVLKGQKPKYIQPARDRSAVVFHSSVGEEDYRQCIIVEDILSAIRVGRHIPAISLLGTKITTAQAAYLARYDKVTTWLDPDQAGRKGAYAIRKTLGLVTEVGNIVTDEDPKCLSDTKIREHLCLST